MFENLIDVKKRFQELENLVSDAEIIAKRDEWQKLVKEHASLLPIVEAYDKFLAVDGEVKEYEELLSGGADPELVEIARSELSGAKERREEITEELKILLLPKDPKDDNNVVIEIRAGAGGDEAGLFGAELMRMYIHYAESQRWQVQFMENNVTELGGVKEVVFIVSGFGAYSKLKYESGVHRVQRVPATESQGRVHTSTVTVAVLPEVEEIEVYINEKDLKIDTYRSGGAGGQHVNKTESAIRITHLPTGLVVTCEDERSQIKNREKAMKVLKSRLYDFYEQQAVKDYTDMRKSQVGTGDRSERIRTYNYPQGRVTDHRIGFTLYSLDKFLQGDMAEMIEALQLYDRNKKLEQANGMNK